MVSVDRKSRTVLYKDVRVMSGVLRPLDETRWEVVCKVNGEL
jgi:hypothetical protein